MRDRISAELEGQRPPLGDFVGQAVVQGRRRKRRARLGASALSAVGVLAVVGAVAEFAPGSSTPAQSVSTAAGSAHSSQSAANPATITSVATSAPATIATSTAPALKVSPIVQHVAPGTATMGKGLYFNYTTDSMSWWQYKGGLTTQYNGTNTWGSGFVSMGGSDDLVTGFYVGDKEAAAAVVTIDGKQYPAVLVKVNGAHGWSGMYYQPPSGLTASAKSVEIDVYDSDGKALATSRVGEAGSKPPPTHSQSSSKTLPVTIIPINTPFPGAKVMVPPGANADGSEPGKH